MLHVPQSPGYVDGNFGEGSCANGFVADVHGRYSFCSPQPDGNVGKGHSSGYDADNYGKGGCSHCSVADVNGGYPSASPHTIAGFAMVILLAMMEAALAKAVVLMALFVLA